MKLLKCDTVKIKHNLLLNPPSTPTTADVIPTSARNFALEESTCTQNITPCIEEESESAQSNLDTVVDNIMEEKDDSSLFSDNEATNAKLQSELKHIEEEKRQQANSCEISGHDMREYDPEYNGSYDIKYVDDLFNGLECIDPKCPNKGLSVGKLIKKKIKVHYCKRCENYKGITQCNHVICNICTIRNEDAQTGRRRSKRTRK